MKHYQKIIILFLIFFLTLGFRLFFVFQTPYYSSDNAYYNIRYTEEINKFYQPMLYDDLSYGGRDTVVSPLYHYFLAFFNTLIPDGLAFKIIPEILLAGLVFLIYIIAKRITENETAALLSAFISGFLPIFIGETLNNISIYSILLVLLFYCIYCLLNLNAHLTEFIILSFIIQILHPFGFVFGLAFLLYLILLNIESVKISRQTQEAIAFFVLIGILVNLILFKKVFLAYGLQSVWQNMPREMLTNYFQNVDVLSLLYGVGFIPLIFGIIGISVGVFRNKNNSIYLISALILTMFTLLFLKMVSFAVGLMFLSIFLTIMSALTLQKVIAYIEMTKFSRFKKFLFVGFIILIAASLVLPSYGRAKAVISETISSEEVGTLEWIRDNTGDDITVLAGISEGNYITAIAKRKNVADSHFLLAPDRYADVSEMLTTESLVVATQLLDEYDVDYIYFSQTAKKYYKIDHLNYVGDENCFEEVYSTERASVYQILC
ncbi:MAG: hypothetical protein V1906_02345 [Candidatus Woesearchaeota archaeon]